MRWRVSKFFGGVMWRRTYLDYAYGHFDEELEILSRYGLLVGAVRKVGAFQKVREGIVC